MTSRANWNMSSAGIAQHFMPDKQRAVVWELACSIISTSDMFASNTADTKYAIL